MKTPLFKGRPNTCLVPFGDIDADPRYRGWTEGTLATEPERPSYDITMVLDSSHFLFPLCGQKVADGRAQRHLEGCPSAEASQSPVVSQKKKG